MKKKYEKPQVYMEKFELSQHIAACDWSYSGSNLQSADSCCAKGNNIGWETTIFTNKANDCEELIDSKEDYCIFAGNTKMGSTWNS